MQSRGTILLVGTLFLVLLYAMWYLGNASEPRVDGVADLQEAEDRAVGLHEVLTGEFKRKPKKNPDLGKGKLRGIVRNGEGGFVAGATVQVTPTDAGGNVLEARKPIPHFWEVESDNFGVFNFRTLRPGAYVVSASKGKHNAVAVADVKGSGAFAELNLSLVQSVARRGVVLDGVGEGVERVHIVPLSASDWEGPVAAYRYTSVMTNESGEFYQPLLPEGAWEALVVSSNYAPKRVALSVDQPTRIQLENGETLQGRLLREEDERPLNSTQIVLTAVDEGGEFYAMRTDGQGYFVFNGLRATDYVLEVDDDRYVARAEVAVPPEAVASDGTASSDAPTAVVAPKLVLAAKVAASIRGRVLAAGAEIGVPEVTIGAFEDGELTPTASAVTDQAGYYQLKGLSQQRYRLVATVAPPSDVILDGEEDTVSLTWGEKATGPEFRVVQGQSVRGTVLDGRGSAVGEANVFVQRAGLPGGAIEIATNQEGGFAVGGLRAQQEITLWAEKLGRRSAEFGPVAVGADGLEGIVLRFTE